MCNGRISDGGVFKNCNIYPKLEDNCLNIPKPSPLPGTQTDCPYVIVADDAFPLKEYLLKPYSQVGLTKERRIFNYRLSRARRVVENAFGILANRFRIFMTPIGLAPEKVESITMACCALHNFLRSCAQASAVYTPPGSFDDEDPQTHVNTPGSWRSGPQPSGISAISQQGSNNYNSAAKNSEKCYVNISIQQMEQWHGKMTWCDFHCEIDAIIQCHTNFNFRVAQYISIYMIHYNNIMGNN